MPAFDDSFDEFSDLTYRVAFRVIGDRGEADGVAQETLIRVAERWHHVEGYAPGVRRQGRRAACHRLVAEASRAPPERADASR